VVQPPPLPPLSLESSSVIRAANACESIPSVAVSNDPRAIIKCAPKQGVDYAVASDAAENNFVVGFVAAPSTSPVLIGFVCLCPVLRLPMPSFVCLCPAAQGGTNDLNIQ
jgi:hypothetical protein